MLHFQNEKSELSVSWTGEKIKRGGISFTKSFLNFSYKKAKRENYADLKTKNKLFAVYL